MMGKDYNDFQLTQNYKRMTNERNIQLKPNNDSTQNKDHTTKNILTIQPR